MTTNNFTLEELQKIRHYYRSSTIGYKAKKMMDALKPRTININGFEVPEPVREKLKNGRCYFAPIAANEAGFSEFTWRDDLFDGRFLAAGQIHLTAEAAQKHNEALVSFTKLRSADYE